MQIAGKNEIYTIGIILHKSVEINVNKEFQRQTAFLKDNLAQTEFNNSEFNVDISCKEVCQFY